MNAIVTCAIVFLAICALVRASIVEPGESARTPHQYGASIRSVKRWPYWMAAVLVITPLLATWTACRFVLYLLSFVAACLSVRLATATAMDGRALHVYRLPGWREVHS